MRDAVEPPGPPTAKARSAMLLMVEGRPWVARTLDLSIVALIVLNVLATILGTLPDVERSYGRALGAFELFSVAVFTAEYLARLALCGSHPSGRFTAPVAGRLRYALTPMALVDLAAILPFYLGHFLAVDLRFLRVLRLFRVFKLTRYSSAMTILLGVLRKEAANFGAALFILTVVLVLAASGIYLVEHGAQPEAFGSIPAAMWWAVATLTTVGYGDVTPVTPAGKFFGALVTIVGIGMVALPAGILASGFSDGLRKRRESFRQEVATAAAEGVLSTDDRIQLDELGRELGLDPDEARRVVAGARDAAGQTCPQCGRGPDPPVSP